MASNPELPMMEAQLEEASRLYYHADLAAECEAAATKAVIQYDTSNESVGSAGGSSHAMTCGQVCNLCGQVCNQCGQVCNQCGQVCNQCGQVCNQCGQVCNLCGGCGGCGMSGGTQTLKVILVDERATADVPAETNAPSSHSGAAPAQTP